MVIAVAAMLLLIMFTGYLIIYNVFQISVTNDIRFYGLLKTIGTNLTNDTGFKPSNIVMKLTQCKMNVNQEWRGPARSGGGQAWA